jgi:hypothetical protein
MKEALLLLAVVVTFIGHTFAVAILESSREPSSLSHDAEVKSRLRGQHSLPISLLESNSTLHSMEEEISNVALLADLPAGSTNVTTHRKLEDEVTDLFKLGALRASMSKEAFDATPFGSSVQKILDLIQKTMMPKVLEAHAANQNELFKLEKEVLKCGAIKNQQVAKAGKRQATYLRLSPLHNTCRAGEAGLSTERTQCHEEEMDKKKIMELKCKEFAMVKKSTGDQTANKVVMKKGGSESADSYVNRITATVCGVCHGKGCSAKSENDDEDAEKPGPPKKCGYAPYSCGCGFKCQFDKAKDACNKATTEFKMQYKKCRLADHEYFKKQSECNSLQDQMDGASCKRAVEMKDACEAYAECHFDKKLAYESLADMVKQEEKDRQAEWRGLERMQCLIKAFTSGKVTSQEVVDCKKKVHSVAHLVIKYPQLPKLAKCAVPDDYPNTPSYKAVNFAPLPALAKGKQDAYQCTGLQEISTTPAEGSPKTCKCSRVTLNGPFSPGPLVKCTNCKDVRRTQEKNSCPEGTKLFSPQSRTDWKTFFASAHPLRAPNWIIDITRPQNGCGGCKEAMNSKNPRQRSWVTSDGSPWWLRSTRNNEPSGDYHASCYLDLFNAKRKEDSFTFNDQTCNYHSKSYYCQPSKVSLQPKGGSPNGCVCKTVTLNGIYSAGSLLRCDGCLRVSRSLQKNSCPVGTKIFSPASRADWKTFLHSATPLRSPHFIIDVTQPSNGCGGCTKNAMSSRNPAQATWRTSDGSPWWLRSSKYQEPNGDYHANCYLNLGDMANENSVTFNDKNCKYNSNAYYCQQARTKVKPPPPAPPPPPSGPPQPEKGGTYIGYACAKGLYTGSSDDCDHFSGLTEAQCSAKCKVSASAQDKKSCDKVTGIPNCVAFVYDKKMKTCMLYRACTKLAKWKGRPDIVTKLRPNYNPSARTFQRLKNTRCNGTPYTQPAGVPKGPKGVTVQQCWDLCYSNKWVGDKDVPVKKCKAMAFFANDGYCDLYDSCTNTTTVKGVLTLKKIQKFQAGDNSTALMGAPAPAAATKEDDSKEEDDSDEDA